MGIALKKAATCKIEVFQCKELLERIQIAQKTQLTGNFSENVAHKSTTFRKISVLVAKRLTGQPIAPKTAPASTPSTGKWRRTRFKERPAPTQDKVQQSVSGATFGVRPAPAPDKLWTTPDRVRHFLDRVRHHFFPVFRAQQARPVPLFWRAGQASRAGRKTGQARACPKPPLRGILFWGRALRAWTWSYGIMKGPVLVPRRTCSGTGYDVGATVPMLKPPTPGGGRPTP